MIGIDGLFDLGEEGLVVTGAEAGVLVEERVGEVVLGVLIGMSGHGGRSLRNWSEGRGGGRD